jgi:adenine-specific DNA-methyltransferase
MKGMFGGKNNIDLKRITGEIIPEMPILTMHKANIEISQMDTNKWVKSIPKVDLMYYDPPYNKHPYNIYYFLLDIINNWDTDMEIPDTYRGQPKDWVKSSYCSFVKAKNSFEDLIKNTKSNFIMLSYNNKGIIPLDEFDRILKKYGILNKIPIKHNVYNKLLGIAAKKRKKENKKVEEFIWLLDCRKKH